MGNVASCRGRRTTINAVIEQVQVDGVVSGFSETEETPDDGTPQCNICYAPLSFQQDVYTSSCGHKGVTCRQCMRNHIWWVIHDNEAFADIPCVCGSGDCDKNLDYEVIQKFAYSNDFIKYEDKLSRRSLDLIPDFCWCSKPGCGAGQIHAPAHSTCSVVVCHKCDQKTCFNHRCKWHEGLTCAEFDRDKKRSARAALARLEQQGLVRRCPKCKRGIEKSGGCDHMTCHCKRGGCGYEFCWKCLAPYCGRKGIRKIGNKAHKAMCPYHM